jgi:hypothetical protein
MSLLINSTIIDYLTIFDVSALDCACTNKKIREYILSLFTNAVISIDCDKYQHLFNCGNFIQYIKIRKLYITNWFVLNNLDYFLNCELLYHYVNSLKIMEYNIPLSQLNFIINNFDKLSMLVLGEINLKNGSEYEAFHDIFPFYGSKLINISDDILECKINKYLKLEYLYLMCENIPYDVCLQLINMSPKLKKIQIRTIGKNFSNLILIAMKKQHINFIEIYDKNTSIEIILNILINCECIGLRINVQGFNYIQNIETIITIFTKNMSIRCILPFIIKLNHVKKIFNLCPNLNELSIEEDIDGDYGEFNYLFLGDLIFPPTLENIFIDSYNNLIIEKIINRVKNIKYIYIEFILDFEIDGLNNLKKKYTNIEFICMNVE